MITGAFSASRIRSEFHNPEIVTAVIPIIRKNNSRLCSIIFHINGKTKTAMVTAIKPAAIYGIGVSEICSTGIYIKCYPGKKTGMIVTHFIISLNSKSSVSFASVQTGVRFHVYFSSEPFCSK